MNKFHGRWVTGLVFIFFDIHILIDWLPDFIGWMFIAAAFSEVKGTDAMWGKWGAIIAAILSVPLVLHKISTLPESDIPVWLDIIFFVRPFAEFLAYVAFFSMSNELLERKKQSVFSYVLLGYLLVWMLWQHIYMHFLPADAEDTTLILGLLGFALFICFLIQVIVRNKEWKRQQQMRDRLVAAATEASE